MDTKQIVDKIEKLTVAERITKQMLSELSRDLLKVQLEGGDAVQLINMLLGKCEQDKFRLTPINWRIACQYFYNFIPHASNYASDVKEFAEQGTGVRVTLEFGKANKNAKKRIAKAGAAGDIEAWLANEAHDIWVWSNNVEMKAAVKDWAKELQKSFTNATDEAKGGMTVQECMFAILKGCDVDLAELLESLDVVGKGEEVEEVAEAA